MFHARFHALNEQFDASSEAFEKKIAFIIFYLVLSSDYTEHDSSYGVTNNCDAKIDL